MPSSFNGVDLFGSGPHRFQEGRRGYLVLPDASSFDPTTRNVAYGAFELQVYVRGRLVAADDAALWVLRDAVQTSLGTNGPYGPSGDLVDAFGRTWSDMRFTRLEWAEEVDRGRTTSIAYEARFLRFS